MLVFALVFVWAGSEFTRFAWNRISELAELPLWLIHIAWPVTGLTWVLFLGEQHVGRCDGHRRPRAAGGASTGGADDRRRCSRPGIAALILFGVFFVAAGAARAGGVRARPRLPADPAHRAAALDR